MSSSAKRKQKSRKDQSDEEWKAELAKNAQRRREKRVAEKNAKMKDSKNLDQKTSLESSSLSHGPDDSGIATMNASEPTSISSQCGTSMTPVRGSSHRGLRKGGDFRQTLPIQERSTRSELIDLSIKRSKLWKLFKVYKLTRNMRAKNDDKFSADLLDIGNGTTIDEDENVVLKNAVIIHENLEKAIFEEHMKKKDFDAISKRAILAPTNIMVDEINDIVLDMLEGDCKIYTSIDEPDESNPEVTVEVLNSFEVSGFPKHCLKLKIGAIIICLRNLNVWISLCNGTRMLILDMKDHVLKCLIINENEKPEEVFIPRISLLEEKESLYKFKRQQFPVRLAFAMTINKAQGQTFDEIGLNLENEVFAHGQLYTACSRVANFAHNLNRDSQFGCGTATNIHCTRHDFYNLLQNLEKDATKQGFNVKKRLLKDVLQKLEKDETKQGFHVKKRLLKVNIVQIKNIDAPKPRKRCNIARLSYEEETSQRYAAKPRKRCNIARLSCEEETSQRYAAKPRKRCNKTRLSSEEASSLRFQLRATRQS